MDKIDTAFGAMPHALDEVHRPAGDSSPQYTPGDFLKQAGAIIVFCLGLAMLAQVLVLIVGKY